MYQSVYITTPLAKMASELSVASPDSPKLSFGVNDGLIYATAVEGILPSGESRCFKLHYAQYIPEELGNWLLGLRLLHAVPLAYLIPDPALFPPESIRFFHVDQAWTDRLVEGALSAANIGTADLGYSVMMHAGIRAYLDEKLEAKFAELGGAGSWVPGESPMTGMLIRSELVRRWPEMLVNAFSTPDQPADSSKSDVPILRKELISKNIMIVIFAGNPQRVEIREPACGTRFGVEKCINIDQDYRIVHRRDAKGNPTGGTETGNENSESTVRFQCNKDYRKLDIDSLQMSIRFIERSSTEFPIEGYWNKDITKDGLRIDMKRDFPGGRDVAIHLSQPPYVQVFRSDRPEEYGASSFKLDINAANGGLMRVPLRNGRFSEITVDDNMVRGVSV